MTIHPWISQLNTRFSMQKQLRFANGYLTSNDLESLGKNLSTNNRLKTLIIQNQHFTNQDMKKLCEGLVVNKTLTALVLCYGIFDAESVNHLCDLVKVNKTLTTLNLNYCKFENNDDLKSLYKALEENNTIKTFIT